MKNTTSIITAFIGGAVVGAAIALLLAPESGKDTRQKIKDFLRENEQDVDDEVFEAKDEAPKSSAAPKTH